MFLCLVMIGSQFSLACLNELVLQPQRPVSWVWLALQVIPLIAVIPGILRAHLNSTFLTILIAQLFFIHGVVVAFEPEDRVFGIIEAVTALGLTAAASLLVRKIREAAAGS